ncbi:MAG: hypothetical protein ACPL1G_06110 [Thermodesulfovibrionales bacterium]
MNKNLVYLVLGILLIWGLMGCEIKTPEIRGVVLDEETKQPVEGAWITATLGIKTKTVGGDVHNYLSVEQPHTRTDKNGRFLIPSKKFKKPSFPAGFGTDIETFGVGASTVDDRGGDIDLRNFLGKDRAEVTIYVKPEERTESEYFSHLQTLYNYCITGRFFVEVPAVEGGCDEWELEYAIRKHERYLENYPKIEETRSHYSIILEQLGLLCEKKGEFEKAIINLKKAKETRFFRPQDLNNEIKRIQQKLKR